MPTPDASQFTQLKKYNAVQARRVEGEPQSRTRTHLFQPIPSVTHPLNFLASFTNKYTQEKNFTPINRITGRQYKPKVPGGNVNGQTFGGGGGGSPLTILEYDEDQGPSFMWVLSTFTRDTSLPNFSYTATITSTPFSSPPNPANLINLTIGNVVTSIGQGAFEDCTGLTSVTIPDSVISIQNYAFFGCTGLTSVTIPNLLTSIGNDAFSYCSGLTSVIIPNSVTSIGEGAFRLCASLISVKIGNSVTNIGTDAFIQCTLLTTVTIPNSVTTIGNNAFYLSGLITVKIANGQLGITSPASGVSFYGATVNTDLPPP